MATSYTQQEVDLWRVRTTDPSFSWIWDDIRTRANSVLSGTYNVYTQYLNNSLYFNGRWPKLDVSGQATASNDIEPRPESSSSQSLLCGAFCYLLGPAATGFTQTQLNTIRTAVINEIVRYAGDAKLNYDNNESQGGSYLFPFFASVNPGFFLCEWMTKLLLAYEYIGGSGTNATCDAWFTKWANYSVLNLNNQYRGFFPNRLSRSYSSISNSGWAVTNVGSMWSGSNISIYGLNALFNNRIVSYPRYLTEYAHMYNNQAMKDYVKLHWKEYLAYGMVVNQSAAALGDWCEYYRSKDDDPEASSRYGGIAIFSLAYIADIFARNGDFSLYNYILDQAEYNIFYSNTSHVALNSVKATGKTLYTLINEFMKLFDQTYNRSAGGERVDGYTTKWVNGGTWEQDYIMDQLFRQINVWYRDENWKTIYNRTKPGTRALNLTRNLGSWSQKYGMLGTQPSHFFMYQDLEDVLEPYSGVTPPPPVPSFTPISRRSGMSKINSSGGLLSF